MRIAGVREGEEHGRKTRDFVAQLLKDVLNLNEKPVTDHAHREENKPPRHLIRRIMWEILHKVTTNKNLDYQGSKSDPNLQKRPAC